MRKFLALAVLALGVSVSAPASAQSGLGGLVNLLNTGRNISSVASSGCSSSGIGQVLCQAQRFNSVSQDIEYQRQMMAERQRQAQEREQRVTQALIRACKAGDQYSCDRAGPVADERQIQLQQALSDACQAGDQVSCRRADDISRQLVAAQRYYRR
jgi:hypothetical protein